MNSLPGPHFRWTAGLCANCEKPLEPTPHVGLYCSEFCHDWAKDVRYWRKKEADGSATNDPAIRTALRTRLAHLVSGGYPARARRLNREARLQVLALNGGLCVGCNAAAAVEVDHIEGDSSELSNLQGLCKACHQAKTATHFQPAETRHLVIREAFLAHVHEQQPLMACHGVDWDQQRRLRERENREWGDRHQNHSARVFEPNR